jgi:hypothetical protein
MHLVMTFFCQTGWQNGRLLPTTQLPLRSSRTFDSLLGFFRLLVDSIVAAALPTGGSATRQMPTWQNLRDHVSRQFEYQTLKCELGTYHTTP